MNKVFTSIILTLGMIGTTLAQGSNSESQPQDPSEIIVLSSYVDGNYNVERLLVMESSPNNNEFMVRYKINLTSLISTYDNNSSQIAGLKSFVESIKSDSLKTITHFDVVGYTSPDGPVALNKRLASARATDFAKFVDKECAMGEYSRTITSNPYTWIDTKAAIQSSTMPHKAEILAIIESGKSQSEIQAHIEKHEAAWDYIKANILPPMRCVELHVKYNSWKVVENRTLIEEVVPEEVVVTGVVAVDEACETAVVSEKIKGRGGRANRESRRESKIASECCDEPQEDYIYCTLVEIPGNAIDYGEEEVVHAKFKSTRRGAKYKERVE